VLRPAAIYGDGEERHLPRILGHVRQGWLSLCGLGSADSQCDWVFVDNLNHAFILAASNLEQFQQQKSSAKNIGLPTASSVAGKAYCISDGESRNNFATLRMLCGGLGYEGVFRYWVPTWLAFGLAWWLEWLRLLVQILTCRTLSFQPILTRSEVAKVAITHFFSMRHAQRDFGYAPLLTQQQAMQRCVEFYMDEFGTPAAKAKAAAKTDSKSRTLSQNNKTASVAVDAPLKTRRKAAT
jgi:nucleoside-diphosphate-sugar epimerase